MATAQSKTFQADPDKVWGAVVKIANGAGYTIKETNAAAKQIVYKASGGGFAWGQLVTVSVSGVEDDETIVTVRAEAEGQATLTEGGQQRKLISFMFGQLEEKFPVSENQKQIANAPGTSGCMGMVLLLLTGAVGMALSVVTLVVGR